MSQIFIEKCSPTEPNARSLLDALSAELAQITGNDGRSSFSEDDVQVERSIFVIAQMGDEFVGCGGLRPITEDVCEIKRMYAKLPHKGIGHAILQALEEHAKSFGYKEIWLETRKINEGAVQFYRKNGYRIRSNYGKYVGRPEAVCFEKTIQV